jgi:hypothetical protein
MRNQQAPLTRDYNRAPTPGQHGIRAHQRPLFAQPDASASGRGACRPFIPTIPQRAQVRHRVQRQTARMSIAGIHGVGMRRCTLTLCPAPARGRGETAAARGSVPPAGVRRHCETGAAGRSNLITAPPAQPVEAICHCEPPQAAKQSPRRRAGMRGHCATGAAGRSTPSLRDRRSRSKQPHHCATGAAGRSNLSLRAAAGGEAICHCEPPQAAKQSPRRRAGMRGHCATGAAGRSNLITAPPAQPVEAISSLRHRRSRSKQSVIASRRRRRSHPLADVPGCAVTAPPAQAAKQSSHPLPRSRAAGEGRPPPRAGPSPRWACRGALKCSVHP